ncbi:MAG: RNA polymerase sigma-70 factor [Bacteroidales bacterium]|nr:RNA polymerase sigma-70 factor [Bacteroidales bacterium]MBN2698214.1 RNA polymerase sigma-70 factor [Bacteroidales bacterium]
MNLKDQYILGRIKNGDIGVFEKLFHRFYPGMCSYAEKLVGKDTVAEEIVQDVFYNIWKNREIFRINASLKGYLYRAVFNNSMMHLRKLKRERMADESVTLESPATDPDPVQKIVGDEMNAIIFNTLENLPERTSLIFRLNRFDGFRYKEIAEQLSISVKTVEANMGKALKALKNSLDKYNQNV